MPEEFTLGLTEVDVAVRRTGLPANWHPFEIRSVGHTLAENARLTAEAWEALRARGLAGPDKLDTEVEHTLRAWTQPEVLIIIRAAEVEDGRQVFYRATIGNGLGVYSELVPEGINFVRIRPDHLVDELVSILPRYAPVPLRELAVSSEQDTASEDFAEDVQQTARHQDREAMSEFSSWPLHRYGTFELSVRHGHGSLRNAGTVTFFDNDGGRFLIFTDDLGGGAKRIRFVPSDGAHLRRWLHETITELRH